MTNYKSATNKTISLGRFNITYNPGITLEQDDAELEALVVQGILLKNIADIPPVKVRTGRTLSEWTLQVIK